MLKINCEERKYKKAKLNKRATVGYVGLLNALQQFKLVFTVLEIVKLKCLQHIRQ